MNKLSNYCGWMALILVQGAALPSIIMYLSGNSEVLPPITLVLPLTVGLVLFLIKSVFDRDLVLILSNGIGSIIQTLVLILLLTR